MNFRKLNTTHHLPTAFLYADMVYLPHEHRHMASLYPLGAEHVDQEAMWCPFAFPQSVVKITATANTLLPHCLQHFQIKSVYCS